MKRRSSKRNRSANGGAKRRVYKRKRKATGRRFVSRGRRTTRTRTRTRTGTRTKRKSVSRYAPTRWSPIGQTAYDSTSTPYSPKVQFSSYAPDAASDRNYFHQAMLTMGYAKSETDPNGNMATYRLPRVTRELRENLWNHMLQRFKKHPGYNSDMMDNEWILEKDGKPVYIYFD